MKRCSALAITIILVLTCIYPSQVVAAASDPIRIIINGREIACDVSPIIVNNRTMVPLGVISDYLGRYVRWDKDNRRAIIAASAEQANTPLPSRGGSTATISIVIDGKEIKSEVEPFIKNGRTMVPLKVITNELGMDATWDGYSRAVNINAKSTPAEEPITNNPAVVVNPQPANPVSWVPDKPAVVVNPQPANPAPPVQNNMIDPETTIMGESRFSADALKALLKQKNPAAPPELADLYLEIGRQYGIRGDIAFSQAAKETRWWLFGGLVEPWQNNYCGLCATGTAATGTEDLLGADPARVSYQKGIHGAVFDSPASGVEAHIQHLYSYAVNGPLPAGKTLLDPRFVKPARGCAARWIDLGGKWAVPGYDKTLYPSFDAAFQAGKTYGHSILNDYYAQLF